MSGAAMVQICTWLCEFSFAFCFVCLIWSSEAAQKKEGCDVVGQWSGLQ